MANFVEVKENGKNVYINIESIDHVYQMENEQVVIVTHRDRIYPEGSYEKITNMIFDLM